MHHKDHLNLNQAVTQNGAKKEADNATTNHKYEVRSILGTRVVLVMMQESYSGHSEMPP